MKFEIVVLPVSGVDRPKEFYAKLGWRALRLKPSETPNRSSCQVSASSLHLTGSERAEKAVVLAFCCGSHIGRDVAFFADVFEEHLGFRQRAMDHVDGYRSFTHSRSNAFHIA